MRGGGEGAIGASGSIGGDDSSYVVLLLMLGSSGGGCTGGAIGGVIGGVIGGGAAGGGGASMDVLLTTSGTMADGARWKTITNGKVTRHAQSAPAT